MDEKKEPLLIVWCIAYNQRNYIKDALEGFVMQKTNFPWEVIVHDDASTDGTTDVILEYASKYPKLITPMIEKDNQWKRGGLKRIISIMNEHYRRGKYIAFCEGDDFWTDPNKLQCQVDFLEANPDYSMCFHSAKKQYECDTIAWINCEHIQDRSYDATEVFVNWTVPTASIVCRKEALDFYAGIRNSQCIQNYDIFIILSCAMIGKLMGMQSQMSVYRIQGSGLTYNEKAMIRTTMNNPDHFLCLKDNFPIVDSKPINDTISKTYFERALIQKNLRLKCRDYWNSFLYKPKRFFYMFIHNMGKKVLRKK